MSEVPLYFTRERQKRVPQRPSRTESEWEFFIDNLLVRIHVIIVMIRWAGLAPWEFEFLIPGSLTSTFPAQTELKAQGPSRTCNESTEEEEQTD